MTKPSSLLLSFFSFLLILTALTPGVARAGSPTNPILFVTQMPIPDDFATIGSTFANHHARIDRVGRGGDLYIRYPNGTLRNLTQEAGYGSSGVHQGTDAIAVRDPHVHWSGTKALFSMVIGAPPAQYQWTTEYWQLYEITGLGSGQTAVITKIPGQPETYNNLTPIYASDGRILFTSDQPRGGDLPHLYPQHDEYESTPTNTGLWSLDPSTGEVFLLQHSPSGSFTPTVDSYGRVIFTRWDHLQRDQQADADALAELDGNPAPYGTFNWLDESADAPMLNDRTEVFPEPRRARTDLLAGTNLEGHSINHFFPWMIAQDGTGEETLNHIGRHDLHTYFNRALNDDPNLTEFIASVSGRPNENSILNAFQIREDPSVAGRYLAVDAPEFRTHASGRIVAMNGSPSVAPDQILVDYITHPVTNTQTDDGETPASTHTGHYRDPLPLSDGIVVAAHTAETRIAGNEGTRANPVPRYDFQLKSLAPNGGYLAATGSLTGGITKSLTYWDPDVLVSYNGPMWELQPVEVVSRPQPPNTSMVDLESPELQIFQQEGVDPAAFTADLAARGLALVVSRNVTRRDSDDLQQPFNLSIPGGVQTTGSGGTMYEALYLQFFQGDQIRGIGGIDDPAPGRRVIAQIMHDADGANPPSTGPEGSVRLGTDGSMAALVPAHRAMSWQMLAPDHEPVVRERYWITFQPGEVRVCASCHGQSSSDQAGQGPPTNPPQALALLLQHWQGILFQDGFESGDLGRWSSSSLTSVATD